MKKIKPGQACYMCPSPATSKEHVPPACLFPEEKDIQTSEFRNNLITVPSCDVHNSKKSRNDEFLMIAITGIVGNNKVAYFHNLTKVKRALARHGNDSITDLFRDMANTRGSTIQIEINPFNNEQLHSSFEHIARGLYYHKFGTRFEGGVVLLMDFLTYKDETAEKLKLVCRKRYELETNKPSPNGANPQIFKYKFFEPDESGLIALIFTFYEGASVFASFLKKGTKEPYFLAGELINAGIKTTVQFPDGSDFVFN